MLIIKAIKLGTDADLLTSFSMSCTDLIRMSLSVLADT